jgi:hypothetical protein
MSFEPCHIEYDLTRRQRLNALFGIWAKYSVGVLICLAIMIPFIIHLCSKSLWFLLLAFIPLWFLRGFIYGAINIIFIPRYHMDIIIEENGLGFLAGGERFWIFLDGVRHIRKSNKDLWTICHHNGTVINIPASAIDEKYIEHMRTMGEKGRTPEGIQAVIERGRRIQQIEAAERQERRKTKKQS